MTCPEIEGTVIYLTPFVSTTCLLFFALFCLLQAHYIHTLLLLKVYLESIGCRAPIRNPGILSAFKGLRETNPERMVAILSAQTLAERVSQSRARQSRATQIETGEPQIPEPDSKPAPHRFAAPARLWQATPTAPSEQHAPPADIDPIMAWVKPSKQSRAKLLAPGEPLPPTSGWEPGLAWIPPKKHSRESQTNEQPTASIIVWVPTTSSKSASKPSTSQIFEA